jgi:hypothetical protein
MEFLYFLDEALARRNMLPRSDNSFSSDKQMPLSPIFVKIFLCAAHGQPPVSKGGTCPLNNDSPKPENEPPKECFGKNGLKSPA